MSDKPKSLLNFSPADINMSDLISKIDFNRPLPEIHIPEDHNLAHQFHKRLVKLINDFDSELDNTSEVGLRVANFGGSVIIHIRDIGYWNPSLIIFHGTTESGEQVSLVQNVTQINILLMKLARIDPSKPKQKIGFGSSVAPAEDN